MWTNSKETTLPETIAPQTCTQIRDYVPPICGYAPLRPDYTPPTRMYLWLRPSYVPIPPLKPACK